MDRENMRVLVSKRMIREGLLRCLERKSLNKISITELCREAQVNRTTFYNHYSYPEDVLKEMCWELVSSIEEPFRTGSGGATRQKVTQALSLIQQNKELLKVIFSVDVATSTHRTAAEAFSHFWDTSTDLKKDLGLGDDEYSLAKTAYGWAGYHMIRQWITEDMDLSPEDMLCLFDKIFGKKL